MGKQKKNTDQSQKAKNGFKFNRQITKELEIENNGETIIFVKPEAKIEKEYEEFGFIGSGTKLQMDHWVLLVDNVKKQVLSILSDATTTYRGQRIKEKAGEGVSQKKLEKEIESQIIELFPQYQFYKISHANVVLFPDKMSRKLKNLLNEEKAVREFSTELNYGTIGLRSDDTVHQIDAAMKVEDYRAVLKEIANNPGKYEYSQNLLANVWKEIHNTYDYMPLRQLSLENAKNHKDHLIYNLKNNTKKYKHDDLKTFAKSFGVKAKFLKTKKSSLIQVIACIENLHNSDS